MAVVTYVPAYVGLTSCPALPTSTLARCTVRTTTPMAGGTTGVVRARLTTVPDLAEPSVTSTKGHALKTTVLPATLTSLCNVLGGSKRLLSL